MAELSHQVIIVFLDGGLFLQVDPFFQDCLHMMRFQAAKPNPFRQFGLYSLSEFSGIFLAKIPYKECMEYFPYQFFVALQCHKHKIMFKCVQFDIDIINHI